MSYTSAHTLFRPLHVALMLCSSAAFLLSGCSSEEFSYDSASLFPENYQSTYTKSDKYNCTKSPTHGNDYVIVWYSPEIQAAYADDTMTPPDGAVALKEQFADESCSEMTSIKVLARDESSASKYKWQNVQQDGSVEFTQEENFCSSCHANEPCKNGLCAY